jgi:glycosyltransferase involved in cell wall biosynthesis
VAVHHPEGTIATARNEALSRVTTPWVVHLDADDELEGGFGVYLSRAADADQTIDVWVPEVRYIHPDGAPGTAHWPRVAGHTDHECSADCLPYGNWVVVGAAVRTDLARSVGWEEWPWSEDWALWLSCYNRGATFGRAPDAVYRAHVRAESRNQRGVSMLEVHRSIARAHGAPVP